MNTHSSSFLILVLAEIDMKYDQARWKKETGFTHSVPMWPPHGRAVEELCMMKAPCWHRK